jgi:hypothetical protein
MQQAAVHDTKKAGLFAWLFLRLGYELFGRTFIFYSIT